MARSIRFSGGGGEFGGGGASLGWLEDLSQPPVQMEDLLEGATLTTPEEKRRRRILAGLGNALRVGAISDDMSDLILGAGTVPAKLEEGKTRTETLHEVPVREAYFEARRKALEGKAPGVSDVGGEVGAVGRNTRTGPTPEPLSPEKRAPMAWAEEGPELKTSGYDSPIRETPSSKKASGPNTVGKEPLEIGPRETVDLFESILGNTSPGLGEGLTIIDVEAGPVSKTTQGWDPRDTNQDGRVGWRERKPKGFLRKITPKMSEAPWKDDPNTEIDESRAFRAGLGAAAAAMGNPTGKNAGAMIGAGLGAGAVAREQNLQHQEDLKLRQEQEKSMGQLRAAQAGLASTQTEAQGISNDAARLQNDYAKLSLEDQMKARNQALVTLEQLNPELAAMVKGMDGGTVLAVLQGQMKQFEPITPSEQLEADTRIQSQKLYADAMSRQGAAAAEVPKTPDESLTARAGDRLRMMGDEAPISMADFVTLANIIRSPHTSEAQKEAARRKLIELETGGTAGFDGF